LNKKQKKIDEDDRRIHVIALVIPRGIFNEANLAEKQKILRDNIAVATSKGYNPIVIVTRMDEISGVDVAFETKAKAAAFTGVSESDIFLHANYYKQDRRDTEIDFKTRNIMLALQAQGRTFRELRRIKIDTLNSLIKTVPVILSNKTRVTGKSELYVTQNFCDCILQLLMSFEYPNNVKFSIDIKRGSEGIAIPLLEKHYNMKISDIIQPNDNLFFKKSTEDDEFQFHFVQSKWTLVRVKKKLTEDEL